MGNYCGTTDVYNRAPQLQYALQVTGTVLGDLIDETEAEIDEALATCGYTVPITDATDIKVLTRHTAQRTAAIAWRAEWVDKDEAPANIVRYEAEWDRFIDKLDRCAITFQNTDPATASQNIGVGVMKFNSDTIHDEEAGL